MLKLNIDGIVGYGRNGRISAGSTDFLSRTAINVLNKPNLEKAEAKT